MDELQEIYNERLEEEYESAPRPRPPEKKEKQATSERQYWIQKTADMLKAPFKVVLWKTINWPTPWIQEMYAYCMKEGNPPAKLWYGLYKKNVKKL